MVSETDELQLDVVEPHNEQKVPPEENRTMLSLRRSSLTHIPEHVLDRGLLMYLCLEGNRICSVLGPLFLLLPRLQWLDLRNNRILSLPAELGSHRKRQPGGLEVRDCPIIFPPRDVMEQGCKAVLRYLRRVLAERPVTSTKTLAGVEKLQLMETEDRLVSLDPTELDPTELDPTELDQTSQEAKDPKPQLPPVSRRKEASAKAGTSPACQDWKAAGKFQETQKELRDKRLQLEQSRQRHKTPPKERAQSRRTPGKNGSKSKKKRPERARPPEEDQEDIRTKSQVQTFGLTSGSDEDRSARKLQTHIRTCVERIQERRRNLRGSVSEKEDIEEVRRSQAQLLEGQIFRQRLENCLIIFTADT